MYDTNLPAVSFSKEVCARKEHRCCECWAPIVPKETYRHDKGCWSGEWSVFKTCAACAALRDELDYYIYEQLANALQARRYDSNPVSPLSLEEALFHIRYNGYP